MTKVFYINGQESPWGLTVFLAQTETPENPSPLFIGDPLWAHHKILPSNFARVRMQVKRENLALSGEELRDKMVAWAQKRLQIEEERAAQGQEKFLEIAQALLKMVQEDFEDTEYWNPEWLWTTQGP